MKTIPPPCPVPETGHRYWRGLDQLADAPEFREWMEREFPQGASEFTDPVSRRYFVKIMSASFLLAGFGLTGCRRPVENILPFAKQPENYIHGVPEHYATAMPTRTGALPLLVRSNDGRPTKIEGNPEHPVSAKRVGDGRQHQFGATDHYAQAAILSLYDPDRAKRFVKEGNTVTREQAFDFLAKESQTLAASKGAGLAFLLQSSTSPSRARLIGAIRRKMPEARWCTYEAIDFNADRRAASIAASKSVQPEYRFDQAKIIVSLDCDFIGSADDTLQSCRRFAEGRRLKKSGDTMSRLYVIEALMSLTGSNADHRLRLPSSAVAQAVAAFAARILPAGAAEVTAALGRYGTLDATSAQWVAKCAEDLLKPGNRGKSIVVAGERQPLAVHLAAHAINHALGNIGSTVMLREADVETFGSITEFAQDLNAGKVATLVILGGNPVYDAPADLGWKNAQGKAKTVIRWGYNEDETGAQSQYQFPATHFLESWGDARSFDGSLVAIQPLIEPLFDGVTELEFLARLGGLDTTRPYDIVRETFKGAGGGASEDAWKKFLHDGFLAGSAAKPVSATLDAAAVVKALDVRPAALPATDSLEVVFHRDYCMDDGRWNNNGWLQEMPDPITKMTWENLALVSPLTAKTLGLTSNDPDNYSTVHAEIISIQLGGRTLEAPAWVQPGMADNVIALALGYGREKTGRVGQGAGFNAYTLRTSTAPGFAPGAKARGTGRMHDVSCAQSHWAMEGRPIIRETTLANYAKNPDFAKSMDLEEPPGPRGEHGHPLPLYPNPFDATKSDVHQWAMSVDLNACVGCGACVLACQSENNVPIVGKLLVGKNREMHWLRIDRYFAGSPENPQVVNQPMMCQHCEAAPCESVCPVNATVHDQEGLNLMVYNRCVGTRYCSNNCPWKVRRFNYFDYNRRPIGNANGKDRVIYKSPLDPRNRFDGEWSLTSWFKNPSRGSVPEGEWNLVKMAKNPDVTVRMRGVMEKCTFCVQRIEQAKISAKVKAGQSAYHGVADGSFTTACAQACPTDAIVFGNQLDADSRVSQLKKQDRDYTTLEFLNTKPRLTYLAKVRNPNPEMPDYYAEPYSYQEWSARQIPHDHAPGAAHDAPAHQGEEAHH